MASSPFLTRLLNATSDHDVTGIVSCFSEDYVNVTPSAVGRRSVDDLLAAAASA